MKVVGSSSAFSVLKGSEYLLDNNFLSLILRNVDVFEKFYPYMRESYPLLDPLVVIEFLKDLYLESDVELRQKFLSDPVFLRTTNNKELMDKLYENILVLSKIYAHNKQAKDASIVDLMLAARLMQRASMMLITKNKKDFPICIFDIVDVVTCENEKNGDIEACYILQLNRKKFISCENLLSKAKKK